MKKLFLLSLVAALFVGCQPFGFETKPSSGKYWTLRSPDGQWVPCSGKKEIKIGFYGAGNVRIPFYECNRKTYYGSSLILEVGE